MLREVLDETELDKVTADSVKHFKMRVQDCWNYRVDKRRPADKIYHPLKLKTEVDKSHPQYIMFKDRCETCGLVYAQTVVPRTRTDVLEKLGVKL